MSADLLREAAEVLRGRARRTGPAPWKYETVEILGDGSAFGDVRDAAGERVGDSDDEGGSFFICDGMYIATMDSGVGLALADWLDLAANGSCCDECMTDPAADPLRAAALVTARKILGRAS
jgi:hypothetical protein